MFRNTIAYVIAEGEMSGWSKMSNPLVGCFIASRVCIQLLRSAVARASRNYSSLFFQPAGDTKVYGDDYHS